MKAGQKLTDNNNYNVMLFPMDEMYITQGEHGSISHVLAMDFVGWNGTNQVSHYPYYAPCNCKCIAKNYNNNQAYLIFESLNPVHFADNTIDYINFVVMHDDNPIKNVGDIVYQGDLLGHTGSSGYATGDHLHLNVARGKYKGWQNVGGAFYELKNSISIYNACFINDTTLYNNGDYNWKTYKGTPTPPTPPTPVEKSKNKWFKYLYSINYRNIKF